MAFSKRIADDVAEEDDVDGAMNDDSAPEDVVDDENPSFRVGDDGAEDVMGAADIIIIVVAEFESS